MKEFFEKVNFEKNHQTIKHEKLPSMQRAYKDYIGVAPITHVRNKNSNTQGSSPNVVKVISHTTRNCS